MHYFRNASIKRTGLSVLVVALIFLTGLFPQPAYAASIRYAAPSATGSGDCSSWTNACTLQTALTGASSGDTIWAAADTYYPTTDTDRTISFNLKNGVSVYGGFAGTETQFSQRNPAVNPTILSGDIGMANDASDNSYHVVDGSGTDSTAVLDGVTITAGNGDGTGNQGKGGGLYNNDSSPTLSNVTFDNNSATQGGGVFNDHTLTGSSPTFTNVTFVNNSASYGGGLYNFTHSNPILVNVTFENNHASPRGGAIYNNNSSPSLTNVTVGSNTAPGGGSAIYLDYGSPTIQDSVFWGASMMVGNLGMSDAITISDSIVQGDCPAMVDCTNVRDVDPLLGVLKDNGGDTPTMALGGGSPAVDAGNNATCAATDQRNVSRPQGANCDMGAFEVQPQPGPGFVVNSAADTDDGICAVVTENDCTLREAINAANSYSGAATITFASAVFSTSQTINLTGVLPTITNTITITGPGQSLLTVDGNNANRVFVADTGSDLTLEGLTIAHGNATGPGGGIDVIQGPLTVSNSTLISNTASTRGGGIYFNGGGTLTVTNTTFLSNTSESGGGIGVRSGTASLTDCIFSDNTATYGGGIYNLSTTTVTSNTFSNNSTTSNGGGGIYNQGIMLTVTGSNFTGNTAPFGGGIATVDNATTVSNSVFSGNKALLSAGGGIYAQGSQTTLAVVNSMFDGNTASTAHGGGLSINGDVLTASVTGSTFSGNSASDYGGGIASAAPLTVTNSTFSGNSAANTGGGIDVRGGTTTTVNNSTISGNSAGSNGGGIYINGGTLTLNNNIIANSTSGGDCHRAAGTIDSQNSLIQDDLTCVNGTSTNNLTGDPLLGTLADNGGPTQTMALLDGSPAINAGDNTLALDANGNALNYDQRGSGYDRIANGTVDMGAYEVSETAPAMYYINLPLIYR